MAKVSKWRLAILSGVMAQIVRTEQPPRLLDLSEAWTPAEAMLLLSVRLHPNLIGPSGLRVWRI